MKTPLKAIREKCLDCTCGQKNEVKKCPVIDCQLYAYRFGKNPNLKREYTDEQKTALSERIKRLNRDKLT